MLAYFRARHLRTEGAAALAAWRATAAAAAANRRAVTFHYNHLLIRGLGGWLIAREQTRMRKAAAQRNTVVARAVLTHGWPEGVAARQRKRGLAAAAADMAAANRARRAMQSWLRFTYYRHMAKVALHWRVRRLGCLTLRNWREAAAMLRDDRQQQAEIAHHFAAATAGAALAQWRALARAQQHRRRALAAAALRGWGAWAAVKGAQSRRVGEAAAILDRGRLERVFFSWRWYTQLRVMKEVAFAHKQRAIRQALQMGEQIARRRARAALVALFTAWRVQVRTVGCFLSPSL